MQSPPRLRISYGARATSSSTDLRERAEETWALQPAPIRPERQLLFEDQACPVAWVAGITPMDPQKEIMQTLLRAIAGGYDALIDSPTGTGKTLALLLPALASFLLPHPHSLSGRGGSS